MDRPGSRTGLLVLVPVGMAACCAIPLLVVGGVFGAVAGIGFGSWSMVAAGFLVFAVGGARWFRGRHDPSGCQAPVARHDGHTRAFGDRTG